MLYDNPLEILEAMGFDGAFGVREWFGRFHVNDLEAIAQALFHMQHNEHVCWPEVDEEGTFLFEEELRDAALDLDIPYRRALISHEGHEVSPSFYSFGIDQRYILEKTKQFFVQKVINEEPEGMCFEEDERHGERHLRLRLVEPSYHYCTLVRLPEHYIYQDMIHVRLDLHRLLHEAIRAYAMSTLYASTKGRSVRMLHWDGAHFVDELWGITGHEYQNMAMR